MGIPRAIPASWYLCPGKRSLEFRRQAQGSDWNQMSGSASSKRVEGPPGHGGAARTRGHSPSNYWRPAVLGLWKTGIDLRELSGAARSFPGNSREIWLRGDEMNGSPGDCGKAPGRALPQATAWEKMKIIGKRGQDLSLSLGFPAGTSTGASVSCVFHVFPWEAVECWIIQATNLRSFGPGVLQVFKTGWETPGSRFHETSGSCGQSRDIWVGFSCLAFVGGRTVWI